jgi:hypothetical protein
VINDAIKSALKITIPSLNSEIAKSVGSMNAAATHRHTNKSPHTINSRSNSPQNQQQQHKQHHATNPHYQQYQQQHMQQQKYQKQNSPPTSNPMQALGAKSANSPPTSITNVVSHLHAAKKEAMLKGTTTTPPSSSVGAALLPPSSQQPRSFSTPSKQPTAQRPNAPGSRPTGVISELDKSKYTLGKWVDTIITQMNDPSIDDIELDDSIKKSNFNPAAAMAKDKEAPSNTSNNNNTPQQQQHKEAVKTRPEFEYVDEQNNDDDIDEDIVPERDEGILILSLLGVFIN